MDDKAHRGTGSDGDRRLNLKVLRCELIACARRALLEDVIVRIRVMLACEFTPGESKANLEFTKQEGAYLGIQVRQNSTHCFDKDSSKLCSRSGDRNDTLIGDACGGTISGGRTTGGRSIGGSESDKGSTMFFPASNLARRSGLQGDVWDGRRREGRLICGGAIRLPLGMGRLEEEDGVRESCSLPLEGLD